MRQPPRPDPKRPVILIVEDEEVLLELLKGTLQANGFRVMVARDGITGVNLYKQHMDEIKVVLTDMGLPALGGWEVLEEVLKMNPKAHVICASGFLDSTIRDEMIRAGAAEFIQKPFVYEKLLTLIRRLIASDRAKS